MSSTAYLPQQIFTGTEWFTDYAIVIENGLIKELIFLIRFAVKNC